MMKVYVVTEETGEYSQTTWGIVGAFANREAAKQHAANMSALSGSAEYASGDKTRYEVTEVEVWADAPERVTRYHLYEIVGPQTADRSRPPYRTEHFYPAGFTGDIRSEIDHDRTPGWCSITVTAATEHECVAEYQRLLREFRERAR